MSEIETVICSKDKLKEVFGGIEEVRAIQTLEYHNKNHLSGSDEGRSRSQIDLLTEALILLGEVIVI